MVRFSEVAIIRDSVLTFRSIREKTYWKLRHKTALGAIQRISGALQIALDPSLREVKLNETVR